MFNKKQQQSTEIVRQNYLLTLEGKIRHSGELLFQRWIAEHSYSKYSGKIKGLTHKRIYEDSALKRIFVDSQEIYFSDKKSKLKIFFSVLPDFKGNPRQK